MNKQAKFRDQYVSLWKQFIRNFPANLTVSTCTVKPYPNRIVLSGARNFRDLGDYPTVDGRKIKKGLLYRSDHLSKLTREDLAVLSRLGLKRIYDLRNDDERQAKPDMLPAQHSIRLVGLPFGYPLLDAAEMQKRLLRGDLAQGQAKRIMMDSYRTYAIDYREQLAVILRGLAEPDALPVLIHCIHGKDRTGLAVSVILEVLKVPRDIILQDYLLSNRFWKMETRRLTILASVVSRFRVSRVELRSLLEARTEYLDAAVKAIDAEYGCMDNYLRQGLELDDTVIERLRDALLE